MNFFQIILIIFISLFSEKALALSEYGLRCDDNKACVKCREDLDCLKCMHRCWNAFGYADSDLKGTSNKNPEELCQQKRSKWCNAQCWDPDDVKDPEYISTKPKCSEKSFLFPEGGIKFPDKKPNF